MTRAVSLVTIVGRHSPSLCGKGGKFDLAVTPIEVPLNPALIALNAVRRSVHCVSLKSNDGHKHSGHYSMSVTT